jgi:hypothetical protein
MRKKNKEKLMKNFFKKLNKLVQNKNQFSYVNNKFLFKDINISTKITSIFKTVDFYRRLNLE